MNKKVGFALGVLGGLVGAGVGLAYRRYRQEIPQQQARVLSGSVVTMTNSGPIEYAQWGSGQSFPVLAIHGGGGGYDQGLHLARLIGGPFCWLSVSRFGYLRTPLPKDADAALQADAYAALLDQLHIEKTAILGASAGGPSAIQFALRHPDRCAALVLMSAVSQRYEGVDDPGQVAAILEKVMSWDFPFWLLSTYVKPLVMASTGVDPDVQKQLPAADLQALEALIQTMQPISLRYRGLIHDITEMATMAPLPLETIQVPTLVLHAADDLMVPIEMGRFSGASIPGARYVEYPDGGHLMMGHLDELVNELVGFLKMQVAAGQSV